MKLKKKNISIIKPTIRYLSSFSLYGPIPDSIGKLTKLKSL